MGCINAFLRKDIVDVYASTEERNQVSTTLYQCRVSCYNYYVYCKDLNYARHHIVRLPQTPVAGLEYHFE